MSTNVGSIHYDLSLNTQPFDRASQKVSNSIGKLSDRMKQMALVAGGVTVTGLTLAAKASWNQVDAVQQATIALKAYEKNGKKVDKVLSNLVSYARSDMGVLFNRKDLFESAQNLKLYGDRTEDLTEHVKILSRSVGLGLADWQGLNNVIGRVGSTGRLYADDLQYLQNAGFKLDSSLSGTTQTFESLFTLLDKGIPATALAGQADTIKGKMIRLQTAFRGVGDAILGVDADSGKFIKGGMGYQLIRLLGIITEALKGKKFKSFIATTSENIAKSIGLIVDAFESGGLKGAFNELRRQIGQLDLAGKVNDMVNKIDVGNVINKLVSGISKAVNSADWKLVSGTLTTAFIGMITGINWVTLTATLVPIIPKIVNDIMTGFIQGIFSWIKNDPGNFILTFATLLFMPAKMVGAIGRALARIPLLGTVFSWMWKALAFIPQKIGEPLRTMFDKVGKKMLTGLYEGLLLKWYAIGYWFSGLLSRIARFFAPASTTLINPGRRVIQGLINGIKSMVGPLWSGVSQVSAKIGQFFKGASSWLWDTGKNIIWGLINGIRSMAGQLWGEVSAMAGKIKDAFTSALKIKSPSKVFMGYGENITEGIIKGIQSTKASLKSEMTSMGSAIKDNGRPNSTSIYGNISIGSQSDADYFLTRLSRNQELASKNIATRVGAVG